MPPLTDTTPAQSLTEALANLNVLWILAIIVSLTLLRLVFVRNPSPSARSVAEMLETGLIAVALVFLIIRPFILQAFYIPSPSMEPTLLGKNGSGDKILVNKFQYRLHTPRRQDVVVFLAPPTAMAGDPPFVKRLIGQPGDRIQVVGGFVSVGARRYTHAQLRQALAQAGVFGPEAQAAGDADQADHHLKLTGDGAMADHQLILKERLAEILTGQPHAPLEVHPGYVVRNGVRLEEPYIAEDPDYDYKFVHGEPLKHDYDPPLPNLEYRGILAAASPMSGISRLQYLRDARLPTEPLPAGHYLMMGDNRNDSNDGTNWGPLESWRVVGPAQFIFWPPSQMGKVH